MKEKSTFYNVYYKYSVDRLSNRVVKRASLNNKENDNIDTNDHGSLAIGFCLIELAC